MAQSGVNCASRHFPFSIFNFQFSITQPFASAYKHNKQLAATNCASTKVQQTTCDDLLCRHKSTQTLCATKLCKHKSTTNSLLRPFVPTQKYNKQLSTTFCAGTKVHKYSATTFCAGTKPRATSVHDLLCLHRASRHHFVYPALPHF